MIRYSNNNFTDQQIESLIDIWLDGLLSVDNDAGWEGDSMLARCIEYAGQPPKPTGNDQSNVAMIQAMGLVRGKHPQFKMMHKICMELIWGETDKAHHILPVISRRYYRYHNEDTGRTWTDRDRCVRIGQTISQFWRNVKLGYADLNAELRKYYNYRKIA